MKTYIQIWHFAAALLLSGNVLAQTVSVGSASGVPGGQAVVQLNWNNNGNVYRSLQFDVNFDLGVLPSVNTSACPIEPYITGYLVTTCEQRAAPNDNQVRLGLLRVSGTIPTGNLGQLTFNIDAAAAPGVTSLTLTGVVIENDPVPIINNGQITINGPAYTSVPAAGALNVGSVIFNAPDPSANVAISNSGAVGTTLEGTCTETADPSDLFTVSNGAFSVPQGTAADVVTVTCDSEGPIATHTGTMSCSHNGDNIATPAVYNLSCTITAGPQPAFSAAPNALNFNAPQEGDSIPAQNFTITNSGDSGTTLQSTGAGCTITGADSAKFSMGIGTFTVPFGSSAIRSVSCDTSEQGSYTAQVDCTHNGSNNPSIGAVALSCEVGPPGPAVYASTPARNFAFVFEEAVAPNDPPSLNLNIRNGAEPGDNDLFINCQFAGGSSPEITYSPTYAGVNIAAGGQVNIALACDAEVIGSYSATLNCAYGVDGSGTTGGPGSGTASYTASCEVRDAEADVDPDPASGTPLTGLADPGGTFPFNVMFTEDNDEDVDGSVDTCSLAEGTNFAITAPVSFPATVPSGGSVLVTVTGTAPDDGSTSVTDTLTCTYFDSNSGEGGTQVSYPLTLQIGGGVVFQVTKAFTGGYDGDVTVHLTCNTGLPLQQQFDINPDLPVFFVVTEFESGAMDCTVTEGTNTGFEPTYVASGDSESDADESGCQFSAVAIGDNNVCAITNSPAPVDVVIEKEWIFEGAIGDEISEDFELTLHCDSEIVGGYPAYPNGGPSGSAQSAAINHWYKSLKGTGNKTFNEEVIPAYPSTSCWVVEDPNSSSAIQVDNGCGNIEVSLNQGDSCLITNTVFFEGIPTLSQWGLAIMALLMLGVGLVGFRRFA